MLNDLKILNGSLFPTFSPNVYDYDVEVEDAISLIMEYNCDYPVTIYGNENLGEGESHVLLEIFDGTKVNTYTLVVNNKSTEEVANFINTSTKVEVNVHSEVFNDIITPLISVVCFMTIVILFCLIFHKRK